MVKAALENQYFSCLRSDYKDVFDNVEKYYMADLPEIEKEDWTEMLRKQTSAIANHTNI